MTWSSRAAPLLNSIGSSLQAITHRGPDHQQVHQADAFAVAHARLSIIDLSPAAHQPFFDDERQSFILFNGEVFNYKQIREEDASQGISYRTAGDTEAVLKRFLLKGPVTFSSLDGFFAIVIHHSSENCWYLARDPFGVKPLYYYTESDYLAFSSEMQGLLALGIPREPDWNSLAAYFHLNYIPQPFTALHGVKQVKPGHYLKIWGENGRMEELPFCSFPFDTPHQNQGKTLRQETEIFWSLFEKAVEKRLISDVPLGAFLSGGIDSSAVVAAAAPLKPGLKTFSIGFSDHELYNESEYAEAVARHFKTDHQTILLKTSDMLEIVPEVLSRLDEPFGDSSALAVYLLSREVRKEVKVALSGDGGDELLGGYLKHRAEALAKKSKTLAPLFSLMKPVAKLFASDRHTASGNKVRKGIKFLEGASLDEAERYWTWAGIREDARVRKLFDEKIVYPEYAGRKKVLLHRFSTGSHDLNRVLATDFQMVLPGDMLVKTDRMSMAHNLEIRSPFLDHELVAYCAALPPRYKIQGRKGKFILRKALESKLPPEILNRPKHGFEVPLYPWLTGPLFNSLVKPAFDENYLQAQGIFSVEACRTLLSKLFSGNPGDAAQQAWGLVVFQQWWRRTMEG